MGVGALLVNCIPPDHVDGMVSYLRDFTDLPLGVYPNLGYFTDDGLALDPGVGGAEYAELALGWRDEGAQIVGGCCGTRRRAHRRGARAPRPARSRATGGAAAASAAAADAAAAAPPPSWADGRGARLYPAAVPRPRRRPGVVRPRQASFMVWRHLFREGVGAHQRCLDVGCGTGHPRRAARAERRVARPAIDVDERAVANTLTNAFRNGVDDRLTRHRRGPVPWTPEERYEVVVASLHSSPPTRPRAVDPPRRRLLGRQLVDQLIAKLAERARARGRRLRHAALAAVPAAPPPSSSPPPASAPTVVDWAMFGRAPEYAGRRTQIERVEDLSDAYHLRVGERDVLVAYLLEITAKPRAR
jgi:hypothetical protein